MDYTVLQPAMFMQGLAAYWPEVVEHGKVSMPYSISAKTCWVDLRDVAEVAALALTGGTRLRHVRALRARYGRPRAAGRHD
jgi:uncharacterized protein YbjT (DUF2867 family)